MSVSRASEPTATRLQPGISIPPGRRRTRSRGSRSGSPRARGNRARTPIAERAVATAAPGDDLLHRRLLGAVAAFAVLQPDVVHAQLVLRPGQQLQQHGGAVHAAGIHDERAHAAILICFSVRLHGRERADEPRGALCAGHRRLARPGAADRRSPGRNGREGRDHRAQDRTNWTRPRRSLGSRSASTLALRSSPGREAIQPVVDDVLSTTGRSTSWSTTPAPPGARRPRTIRWRPGTR